MTAKKPGFTLVEIIFSIAFLSLVSVVILQLFLTSDDLADKAQKKNFATLYASNAIELAKAQANANELPASDSAQIQQHFDTLWRRLPSADQAAYSLTLSLKRDGTHIILLTATVVDDAQEELARIETAHYLKGGPQ